MSGRLNQSRVAGTPRVAQARTMTVKVNWALRGPVPWTAPAARGAGTVHLGVDLDGFVDVAADLSKGQAPRRPFVLFGQMTTADQSRSPSGTESARAYTHVPINREVSAGDGVRTQVERVEEAIERVAPGFRSLALARTVQTPQDLEGADANLVYGTINGGTASLHQQILFRPIAGRAGPRPRSRPLSGQRVGPPRRRRPRSLRLERRPHCVGRCRASRPAASTHSLHGWGPTAPAIALVLTATPLDREIT